MSKGGDVDFVFVMQVAFVMYHVVTLAHLVNQGFKEKWDKKVRYKHHWEKKTIK